MEKDRIEGRNPVIELLKSNRDIDKIFVQKGERNGSIKKIISLAADSKIVIQQVDKRKLDELSETGAHQGVIAFAAMMKYVTIDNILQYAKDKGENPFIIILDEINDPHNMGSIIRTAEAAGVHGIIIPKRRNVGVTATVAKASAGAIEYMNIVKVTNIPRTIESLKEKGIWVSGLDIEGEKEFYEGDFNGAIALVIGNEGKGMGRLVKEKCDFLYKIPMYGNIQSLNASVAGAILIYQAVRQRKG